MSKQPEIRLSAPVLGHNGKVEIRHGEDWIDISHIVTGAQVDVDVGHPTKIHLSLLKADVAAEALLSQGNLEAFAVIVDEARAKGWIA